MTTEAVLSLRHIVKDFPGVRALDDASLELRPGEVHGLVGENGAGKSTLIKILAGIYRASSGTLSIGGVPLSPVTPEAVHAAGLRFIHQELHLVPHFTVAESVFMGQEIASVWGLRRREMRVQAERFLRDRLGAKISGARLIRDLGTAERKLVQIARALIDGRARVVVFDEPTAPLASEDTHTVLNAIGALRAQGIAVLYVSHYLAEITAICDRVTVLRRGRNVAVFDPVAPAIGPDLVRAMIGHEVSALFPARSAQPAPAGPGLEIRALSGRTGFAGVTLSIPRGTILGLAGLVGSGREELIDTLFGLRRARGGEIRLEGRPLGLKSPAEAVAAGLVLVPRDRRQDGLVLPMTVAENVTLATLARHSRLGLLSGRSVTAATARQVAALDIRPPDPSTVTRFLSGGNQQKVVLGRWMARQAQVYLFDDPTVGVDIGARAEIYQLIRGLAEAGASVIVASGDPAELIGLCDRVAVMMRGRVVAECPAEGLELDRLVALTTGAAVEGARHVAA